MLGQYKVNNPYFPISSVSFFLKVKYTILVWVLCFFLFLLFYLFSKHKGVMFYFYFSIINCTNPESFRNTGLNKAKRLHVTGIPTSFTM